MHQIEYVNQQAYSCDCAFITYKICIGNEKTWNIMYNLNKGIKVIKRFDMNGFEQT